MLASIEQDSAANYGGISGRVTRMPKHKVSKLANSKTSFITTNKEIVYDRTKLLGLYTNARSLANKMGELELLI